MTFSKTFPVIALTDDLILREHTDKDIQSFFEYYTTDVNQFIIAPKPQNLNDAKAEIQYCKNLFHFKRGIYWSIATTHDDKMIGAIGLTIYAQNKKAELHYDLGKAHWNQGIITQAIQHIMRYAFESLHLIRVEALTMRNNMASQKVLLKNNFIYEGCLHAYKYYENQPMDVDMFAITAQQYKDMYGDS